MVISKLIPKNSPLRKLAQLLQLNTAYSHLLLQCGRVQEIVDLDGVLLALLADTDTNWVEFHVGSVSQVLGVTRKAIRCQGKEM